MSFNLEFLAKSRIPSRNSRILKPCVIPRLDRGISFKIPSLGGGKATKAISRNSSFLGVRGFLLSKI